MKKNRDSKILGRFRRNPLIDSLIELQGNPKVLILLEPLWGIPYYLIMPYIAIFMRYNGLNKFQIGSLQTIFMVSQVFMGFLAGALTDKYGRKKGNVLGDMVGWSFATFMFAISRNYWMFVVGYLLNSFEQINQTAWVCLLIEDAEDKHVLNIHNWITIGGLITVIFAPLSGIFIKRFSVVPVVRILYLFFSVSMFLKPCLAYKYCDETRVGKKRMEENKNRSIVSLVKENYSSKTIKKFFSNSAKRKILLLQMIFGSTKMIMTTFINVYAKEQLNVPESFLSSVPIINTGIMLLFMFALQGKMKKIKIPMLMGTLLYMLSQLAIIIIPKDNLALYILYIMLEAVCFALVFPRKSSLETFALDKNDRAKEQGIFITVTLILMAPFGAIAGALSEINSILPFVLNIVLFIIGFIVILTIKEPIDSQEEDSQEEPMSEHLSVGIN